MRTAGSMAARLDDLERQEDLCRRQGFNDLADAIAERANDEAIEFLDEFYHGEPEVEPRTQVGIFKGGL